MSRVISSVRTANVVAQRPFWNMLELYGMGIDPSVNNATTGSYLIYGGKSWSSGHGVTGPAHSYVPSVAGTNHEIYMDSIGNIAPTTGAVILLTPQDIDTNSDVEFGSVGLGNSTISGLDNQYTGTTSTTTTLYGTLLRPNLTFNSGSTVSSATSLYVSTPLTVNSGASVSMAKSLNVYGPTGVEITNSVSGAFHTPLSGIYNVGLQTDNLSVGYTGVNLSGNSIFSGNVGIGITGPVFPLQVTEFQTSKIICGTFQMTGNSPHSGYVLISTDATGDSTWVPKNGIYAVENITGPYTATMSDNQIYVNPTGPVQITVPSITSTGHKMTMVDTSGTVQTPPYGNQWILRVCWNLVYSSTGGATSLAAWTDTSNNYICAGSTSLTTATSQTAGCSGAGYSVNTFYPGSSVTVTLHAYPSGNSITAESTLLSTANVTYIQLTWILTG